ncbi:hypothetical protein HID58_034038 [Brassica napus]|uniref:Uncharacterized protein n=1 Tax=Brassica napus TaxID=3708 RepID=A0ABQ8C1V9_BRANA|nr:hypothetical protein HID58_034038 [Brassica napus]
MYNESVPFSELISSDSLIAKPLLLLLMDLETENRIASVLLREAAELRRQAEKDGVRAYLEKPNVRHRPNSRFLTATVLGVQQLCDILLFVETIVFNVVTYVAVETNEMWKAQKQENERLKRKSREESSSSSSQMKRSSSFSKRSLDKKCSSINEERKITHQSSLDKRLYLDDDDEGTNMGEALLVLGWMKLSLIFSPRRLINCKVLIQGKGRYKMMQ